MAMKPELQRLAIAEICGWNWRPVGDTVEWLKPKPFSPPHYLESLDAMHEAEKILRGEQQMRYSIELIRVVDPKSLDAYYLTFLAIHATPIQRAEAFLRAIGKWTDSPQ